jgi:hypothetical protein
MNRIFTSIALALIALAAVTAPAQASVRQLQSPAVETMHHNKVVAVEWAKHGKYDVDLTDGSRWRMTLCGKVSDRNCLWAPNPHAHYRGRNFANIHGHRYYFAKGVYVPRYVF